MLLTNAIVTFYCSCTICCGPKAANITASGIKPKQNITVAAPRNIPFGTRVSISGLGNYIVQDRTAKRYNGRWDIYVNNHNAAKKLGKRTCKIQIH